jgi:hypothetical protein
MTWTISKLRITRRRLFALGTIVLAVVVLLLRFHPQFGEWQFNQLQLGMTEDEVTAILGCPPGDYRPAIWSQPDWYVSTTDMIGDVIADRGLSHEEVRRLEEQDIDDWVRAGKPATPTPARVQWKCWTGRRYSIDVALDSDGHAIQISLVEMCRPRPPPDILRRIRWYLGW